MPMESGDRTNPYRLKPADRSPRKTWGTCRALPESPHTATHKSGYCDLHHWEWTRAMKVYSDMVYNHRSGRSPRLPPSKIDYIDALTFTPIKQLRSSLDDRTLYVLEGLLNDLQRCTRTLTNPEHTTEELHASIQRMHDQLHSLLTTHT